MGRINTGGAKKRTGDNIALASSVSGTTLKLNPPKGYYDGVTGTVNITDADFVASKILKGINLFGINGTLEKLNIYSSSISSIAHGSGNGQCNINLGVRPKMVVWWFDSPTSGGTNEGGFGFDKNGNVGINPPTYWDTIYTQTYETTGFRGIGTTFKVRTEDYAQVDFNDTGFTFYTAVVGRLYTFIAIY